MKGAPPTQHTIWLQQRDLIYSVDERARQCNRRWGMNRLPHLVPIEWMEKFKRQKHAWELACFEAAASPKPDDLERVRKQAEAMLRAFDKLEELVIAGGHFPDVVDQWEFELTDGTPVILVRDRAELSMADPKGRTVQIWSLEEIADIVEKFPMLTRAKETFPGAEVIQTRTSKVVVDELNDSLADLPF